ncbi:Glycosyl transferase [Elaphomyces granulatus]
MADEEQKPTKVCFVTIGATAPFNLLLSNVLNTRFLDSLSLYGYTDLLIQFGNEGRVIFEEYMHKYPFGECGLNISGFDFNKTGLSQEMLSTKGNKDAGRRRAEGMILSHAGSGSILEALRIGIPLVVVPNPALQDNHQQELADELSKQGYAVSSDPTDIASAVRKAESLRSRLQGWPPINSGQDTSQGLDQVMADEMGFID